MTQQTVQLTGMPYVPGVAGGILQHGMSEDAAQRIVVLKQSEPGPFMVRPAGFIVVDGAPFSHHMIPLLGMGIPTVIVSTGQVDALRDGMKIMLNGMTGLITSAISAIATHDDHLHTSSCVTTDGVRIQLRVSARDVSATRRAAVSGADAIGLVRSEFLVPPDGHQPNEEFYRHEFKALCEAAAPLAVTIRLIDIAADKLPAWMPPLAATTAALGLQGVRLFTREPVRTVYLAQLAAIDALSDQFDLRILIPYVASQKELVDWLGQVRQTLSRPVVSGAMAETPAAALQIGDWLETADFVALGCNDLMQCLFGADRDRPELRRYLDPHAPSLYRFLHQVANAAPGQLHRVQLCGVLPQLPGILPVLLGLGFRVFSVEATSLDHLRKTIAVTSIAEASELASGVCAAKNASGVQALLYSNAPG